MKQSFGWRILVIGILLAVLLNAVPVGTVKAALTSYEIFTLQIHLPEGAEIEWLRLYFYDSNPDANSTAWITTYDGAGNVTDLISVTSDSSAGYGFVISNYVGHVVDNTNLAYVLNVDFGVNNSSNELCGLRVAYMLP